ncbi:hypothetical protein ACFFWE_10485 [Sphaerisporangium melleum]|uniref:hypothetical protein n=1 Tax=Sphaerisporangium melleum TaxID=321316 RepID=UPI00166CC4A2|nr:hypothetical protein [Sphaerisporangium melleum]
MNLLRVVAVLSGARLIPAFKRWWLRASLNTLCHEDGRLMCDLGDFDTSPIVCRSHSTDFR